VSGTPPPGVLAAVGVVTALVHDDVESAVSIVAECHRDDQDQLVMALAMAFANLLKAIDRLNPGASAGILARLGTDALGISSA
jgi:hypothetical protein